MPLVYRPHGRSSYRVRNDFRTDNRPASMITISMDAVRDGETVLYEAGQAGAEYMVTSDKTFRVRGDEYKKVKVRYPNEYLKEYN